METGPFIRKQEFRAANALFRQSARKPHGSSTGGTDMLGNAIVHEAVSVLAPRLPVHFILDH